jgi:hypothetical protein
MPASQRVSALLLGLLREIYLGECVEYTRKQQFFPGTSNRFSPLGSAIATTWWYSAKSDRLAGALAKAVRERLSTIITIHRDDAKTALERAIACNELNRLMPLMPCKDITLFDVYTQEVRPEDVVRILWQRVLAEITGSLGEWLFIYPLRNLRIRDASFDYDGARIVVSDDGEQYSSFTVRFPGLRDASLTQGTIGPNLRIADSKTPAWLFITREGSKETAAKESKRCASTLLGVILSAHRLEEPLAFVHSAASANETAAIFGGKTTRTAMQTVGCGPLLHPTFGDHGISSAAISKVHNWLRDRAASPPSIRARATVAAQWINQAAASTSVVRFLLFFFAIDALFGERDRVEESVRKGITDCVGTNWADRCGELFALRSELVHGGAASVSDWKRYDKYRDHFQSNPTDDIEVVAATSLLRFFDPKG